MIDRAMYEPIGFWICFSSGMIVGVCVAGHISGRSEDVMIWIEKRLHIPWFVQVLLTFSSLLLSILGWHIMCLGNMGRWPGYPAKLAEKFWAMLF